MPRAPRWVLALLLISLVAAACIRDDGSAGEAVEDAPAGEIVDGEPADETDGTVDEAQLVGVTVNKYALNVGDCFNRYTITRDDGTREEVHTVLECDSEHFGEVYAEVTHPGTADEPYPGEDAMAAWATDQCYATFEPFVGEQYEVSALQIGTVHPTFETWSDPVGLHRKLSCFVHAFDGDPLRGSMEGLGL